MLKKTLSVFLVLCLALSTLCMGLGASLAAAEDAENGIYLSDIEWESWAMYGAKSTDANPAYRPSRDSEEHGGKLTIAGKQYDKGLRTHPDPSYPADIVYDISSYGCNVFTAIAGKDSAGGGPGVVQFQVLLDGEMIAQSPLVGPGEIYEFNCSIAGGSKLTLRVTDGGDGLMYDSSAWGNAMIRKDTQEEVQDVNITTYGTPIVCCTDPKGQGNKDIGVICDGVFPELPGSGAQQYDTWGSTSHEGNCYFGMEFNGLCDFTRFVYQTGMHFPDGGWFVSEGLKLQVRQNGEWVDAPGYTVSPELPGNTASEDREGSFAVYTFTFQTAVKADAIRIVGAVGGFTSCAEIAVYATAEPEEPEEPLDPEAGIYLSDIEWESWAMYCAHSTDASPAYRPSRDSEEHGGKITIAGQQYEKGLRTHPDASYPADIVYDISGYDCNVFTATVGKDSAGIVGGAQFQVLLDGEVIAQSDILGPGESHEFRCDIAGGSKLTLRVTDGGDGITGDSVAWGNAMIRKEVVEPKPDPEAGIYLSDIEWESWAMYASKSTDAAPAYTPSRDSEENGGKITIAGQQYDKGLRTHPDPSYPADIVYDISDYGCNLFTATVGKDSAGLIGVVQFQVLLDGELIAQSPLVGPNESNPSYDLACSIAGGSKLTLRVTDGGDGTMADSSAWANAMIRKGTAQEEAQTVIGTIATIGEVTKDNYESKKAAIDIAEAALAVYDKAHGDDSALALITNRQALADAKAAYDKFSTEPDEPFDPKVGIYLSDIEWESWVMIGGKSTDAAPPYTPSRNSEENGGKITIAGKQYDKGLRTHPDNDTPADIVYDISRYECTTFSAVVGKDSAGSMGNVQFIVLLDDKVVAESPLLYPGEDSTIECDITGGSKLTLRVTCGDDGYMGDSSAWGNARIHSNPIVVPDEPRKGWVDTTLDLTVPTGAAYISDMEWESWSMYGATSEDKVPAYEPSFNCNEAGGTLTIAGIEFQKGIRTHVDPSTLLADIVYDISGYEYDLFRAVVGKDSAGPSGNTQFQILVDDVLVVESPILEAGKACMLTVEIAGAKKITLRVRDGRDGIAYDSAGWGNAILYYAPITQANQVVKLIQALPEVDALTIDDQLPLEKAQLAFQNLSSDEKQKVPADLVDKLQALVAKMKGFQELEAVARVVAEQIQALPAKDQLTLRDFDKVKAARAAYEGLTQEQKPYLSESDLAKLTEAEAYLKPLMEAYQTERAAQAQEVIQAIDAIGEITGSNYKEKKELLDAADVALKRYEMLYAGDEEAAGLITNRSTWNDAWEAYQALQNQVKFGDINADGSIDAQDALLALQHSVGLITLTEEQMARADVDGSEQIDAADALLILQRSMDLISQFPVEG